MKSALTPLSMSSATGKQVLSLIRSGDYAHAGEEEAIRRTLDGVTPSPTRAILDMGCGLGVTADYISRLGLGIAPRLRHFMATQAARESRPPNK